MARSRKKNAGGNSPENGTVESLTPENQSTAEVASSETPVEAPATSEDAAALEQANKREQEAYEKIASLTKMVESLAESNAAMQQLVKEKIGAGASMSEEDKEALDNVNKDNDFLRREVAKLSAKQVSEEELQAQGHKFLMSQFVEVNDPKRKFEWHITQSPFRSNGRGGRARHAKKLRFFSTSPSVEISRHEYSMHSGAMLDESNSQWEPIGFNPSQFEGTYQHMAA